MTAFGTVAASLIAAASAWFSFRLYKGENKRRKDEAAASTRKQASLVTAWMPPGGNQLIVNNGSGGPIANCTVMYRTRGAQGSNDVRYVRYAVIPAGDDKRNTVPDSADALPDGDTPVYVAFRDADGNRWLKDRKMRLHSLDSGKTPTEIAPELAEWFEASPTGVQSVSLAERDLLS